MLFLTTILIILNLLAVPIFLGILRKMGVEAAIAFTAGFGLISLFVGYYTFDTFGGAFGPGILLYFASCFIVPASGMILATSWSRFFGNRQGTALQKRVFLVGGIVIIIFQTAPIVGTSVIGRYCDKQIQQAGNQIVEAVLNYQQNNGTYPTELNALMPAYISTVPTYQCFAGDTPPAQFQIQTCGDAITILKTESSSGSDIMRFNFNTGQWSSISFLDGECNYLR